MSGLEQLKITFFEECNELLQSLEGGLADIREGTSNEDTVHAIFRAVHSIKGGAGVFGFSELIDFAHVFETVMDEVRKGNLATGPDVIDILLRANDTLADLVEMARKGQPVAPGYGSDARSALDTLLTGGGEATKKAAQPAAAAKEETEEFSFVPVKADSFDDQPQADQVRTYSIVFRPKPDILKKNIDPGFLLNVLRSMGKLDLVPDPGGIPPLSELEHDSFHIGWTGCLETTSPRAEIESIFAPVAGDCEFTIADLTPGAAPAEPAAPVVQAAPAAPPPPAPAAVAKPTVSAAPPAPAGAAPAASPPKPAAAQEAPAPANGKEPRGASKVVSSVTIRVELEKIDRVVNMVGELVIAQAMLQQVSEELPRQTGARSSNILSDLVRHTRGLKDSVMAIRAQPVSSVFQRMPRLVRELSAKTRKKVAIEMGGETTEVG